MKKSIGKFDNQELYLVVASYQNNNRIYLAVETEEEGLYADITINLSDMLLPGKNYIFVSSDMSKELRKFLEDKGIIGETLETYQYNMGRYDMAKIDLELIKEYDPEGFKQIEKNKSKDDREL